MWYERRRGWLITLGIAAVLLSAPAESSGCCDWLFGGWGSRTTYSAPYVAPSYAPSSCAPACTSCAPACTSCVPQTVQYLPQTCYRTVYRPVQVTACSACTGCDPCSGCPVTYYRPVTTWTYQATRVPYTTYRLVYSNPCCPSVSCGPCAAGSVNLGTTLGTGGACCPAVTSGTTSVTQPNTESSEKTDGQPAGGGAAPKTFQGEPGAAGKPPEPFPDPNTSSNPGPSLTDPGTRTTFRPLRQAVGYRLITSPSQPGQARPAADDGGWRVARD